MKFGFRMPSLKKSLSARTTGHLKREIKKEIIPGYGKKGMGWLKDPKKAAYNKIYNKTTTGCLLPMLIFIFFIAFSITSIGSVTEEYNKELLLLEKQYEKNMAEDYSTTGMVIATNDYYDELDKVLNKVYKELMATLSPEEKISLRDSQRAWIKFREKEVAFSADLYSKKEGTIYRLFTPANRVSLMKNRIMDLVGYLSTQKDEL